MNTRAEEIAAEGPYRVEKSSGVWVIMGPQGRWPFHFSHESTAKIRADDFNKVYKQGQQDRWIPVSQFKAPAPGQTILFGSKNTVRMWTWDANNDEPPSSWATHYRLIELPPNPEQP